jgi:uncharacterized protein YndB with AHSA1/START domain
MAQASARRSAAPSASEEFVITRVFDAPRELVWKAFTEREHLMHWWGPKGFKMLSGTVDLRVGGVFHYCLEAPDGTKLWGKFAYREIVAPDRLVYLSSFSDENQGVTRHPMAPTWPLELLSTITFAERGGKTTVTVRWTPHNATEEERTVFVSSHDSMRQGWGGTLDQLADYLGRA